MNDDRCILGNKTQIIQTWYALANGDKILDFGPFTDEGDADDTLQSLRDRLYKIGVSVDELRVVKRDEIVRTFSDWLEVEGSK